MYRTLEDYADSSIPRTYIEKILDCLVSCTNNAFYDKEDGEFYSSDGIEYEFSNLLDELEIPEKWHKEIYNTVKCPCCGSDLDAYSTVYVDFTIKEQRKYDECVARLTKKSSPKINEFYEYLVKYPYLGAKHKVGKEIIDGIERLETIDIENEDWYRARVPHDETVYGTNDMKPPTPDLVKTEGRFNHYGQSHYYLAESKEICAAECSHGKDCIVWIQKVHINELDRILDLTKDYYGFYENYANVVPVLPDLPIAVAGLLLNHTLTKEQKTDGAWKPEYLVPRFIADVCKSKGIKGIKYPSSIAFGSNLVVFDFDKWDYNFVGDPEIFKFEKYNFIYE